MTGIAALLSVAITVFLFIAVLVARWYEKRHPDDND